jgi:hypothetical protein
MPCPECIIQAPAWIAAIPALGPIVLWLIGKFRKVPKGWWVLAVILIALGIAIAATVVHYGGEGCVDPVICPVR